MVLTIIAIMAGLTFNALSGLNNKARFGLQASNVLTALQQTRADSFGRGTPTAFVIDTAGNRYWGIRAPGINPSTFLDTFTPATPGDAMVLGTLAPSASFGPTTGFGATLTRPFSNVPSFASSSPAPNLGYCSFCRTTGANSGFGLMVFEPNGLVRFNAEAPTTTGQQFSVTGTVSGVAKIQTIAIIAASGAIERFEK